MADVAIPDGGGRVLKNGEVAELQARVEGGLQDSLRENANWRRRWSDPQALCERLRELGWTSPKVALHGVGVLVQLSAVLGNRQAVTHCLGALSQIFGGR